MGQTRRKLESEESVDSIRKQNMSLNNSWIKRKDDEKKDWSTQLPWHKGDFKGKPPLHPW
jgi:hypothetical protein